MKNKIKLLLNPTLFLECLIFGPLTAAFGFFMHYLLSLAENYDLCLNSASLGIENCIDIISKMAQK